MISFVDFLESKEQKDDTKAIEVIIKGINLKNKDFWEDFIYLCGNAEGMAQVLDVPKEKITGVAQRINQLKDKIENKKEIKLKDKLIKTGDKV
jgi:hypothetical protein